jgi:hypothetical protein
MMSYRIFLSSPGDCTKERTAIHEIIARLNTDPLVASFVHIEVAAWDWGAGVPFEALASPQSSVNEHIPLPEDCDLFLGIFRCKIGSPLPTKEYRKVDGKQFLSGSEYEFHRAWDARRRGRAKPEILIYRLQQSDNFRYPKNEQFKNLQTFFNNPPFKEGSEWLGAVNWYQPADFAAKFEGHLRKLLSQRQPGTEKSFNDWLKHQASLVTTYAGARYTRNAHLETDIGLAFDWLLARQPAIATLDKSLSKVWQDFNRDAAFDEVKVKMERIAEALRNDMHWQSIPDFNFMLATLSRLETMVGEEYEKHEKIDKQDRKGDTWRHQADQLVRLASYAQDTSALLNKYAVLTSKRLLLLIGPAGQGKTHTLVHEINRTVTAGGIAIGVLGQMLNSSDDLGSVILKRIGWSGNFSQFLDKLENEAANRKQRALIVIDALNETPDRRRWRSELHAITQEIFQRPHLTLAFSVRSDYLPQVIPILAEGAEIPWVEWIHPGFAGIEPDALLHYFELFGVKAPVAPPLGEFSNPLYVQLLAKSLRGKQLKHWLPSWLEVWQAWMEYLEQEVIDKLDLNDPSRPTPLRRTMNRLAQTMLDAGRFTLPRHQADEIARQITGIDHVIGFLCSAGALIDRPDGEDEEIIEFGFERLSDTFLTDRLLENLFKGMSTQAEKHAALSAALAHGGSLHPLACTQWSDQPLVHRRSGFLKALCLAVPPHIGTELPTLIPQKNTDDQNWQPHDWQLAAAFNDSLRWRNRPDEFGAGAQELFGLWQKLLTRHDESTELDELVRFALIPEHPFALEHILHPHLLAQDSPGARDACWSIYLPRLWFDEQSNLRQLIVWAGEAPLSGIHPEIALPAARMLAWCGSASQNELRLATIKGLTRLLVVCPTILDKFLPDFLEVNDAYILEAVLVAVWGVMLDGGNPQAATLAARLVYESQFPDGKVRWAHITLRHYARRIVEEACQRGWLPDIDPHVVQPPYQSSLSLDKIPSTKDELELLDKSSGFRQIIFSSTEWDFYRYIMGGNSASINFTSQPLSNSLEPARPFTRSENFVSHNAREDVFDLGLAGRFVAWNCFLLGWTSERFNEFDTGHYTSQDGRISRDGRTERIGKKYQWISWYTLLAFLSDNYRMRPDWGNEPRIYNSPDQVGVDLHDPARWLRVVASIKKTELEDGFWRIPSSPSWPLPNFNEIRQWIDSAIFDLPPNDVIVCVPDLPEDWGEGNWIKLFSEHSWKSDFAPGQWALGNRYLADIWWQITPMLIHADDLPKLLNELECSKVQKNLIVDGRIDLANDWHVPLTQWPTLKEPWDEGFRETVPGRWVTWLPVPLRPVVGECGHPDRRDEHAPVCLPLPSLFQEWNLELDLHRGIVLHQGEPLFGLAGWIFQENALFARVEPLRNLLAASGYTLIWCMRGERRAFLNLDNPHAENASAWADYHGIGFLGSDGRVQTAWLHKQVRRYDHESPNSTPLDLFSKMGALLKVASSFLFRPVNTALEKIRTKK